MEVRNGYGIQPGGLALAQHGGISTGQVNCFDLLTAIPISTPKDGGDNTKGYGSGRGSRHT